jgi:hypothetical protein
MARQWGLGFGKRLFALRAAPVSEEVIMRNRVVVAALVALLVGAPARAANYTDWWWGGSALTGQGLNVGQHGSMIFASWFAYDESGRGMWVVFSGPLNAAGNSVTGTLYRTTGPALGSTFDPAGVVATAVGTGTLNFADMHHATFSWTVDGKAGTLDLVRQSYGAIAIAGRYEGTTDGKLSCSDMMNPGPMPMPMPMPEPPMDVSIHGPMTLSITMAGSDASGVAAVDGATCSWTGTATQSGQTVHILGTAMCPSPLESATLDLTLLALDRTIVGWQKMTTGMGMGMSGCTRTEQFALVPAP